MNELEKLGSLLHHWKEHNLEHAETYRKWAEKTAHAGKQHLSDILSRLYHDTESMDKLFDEALKEMKK
jgi:hypothetical protein